MAEIRRIRKVLIANRGEIAVRIIRTCRRMGLGTVAVFSDADRNAPHVRLADEAYHIGPAPAAESYLRIDKLIDVARRSGADAVHPGYGFLSENAAFAEACKDAGLLFIGPPPQAIRAMGDKTAARAMMAEAGVPMAPGTEDAVDDVEAAEREATRIGFPVLIKAAAGGGGKGMRVVEQASDFASAFEMVRSEALSAFGDARVFLEKFIDEPRHIEFQILADSHGNVVHLFERECSIQRRHQKVIEEAPSAVLTPDVREAMGRAAIDAARACGYVNAGTVEFLVDAHLNFYFMEMNTRLQVEHPVTEAITGIDLVEMQIRIAEGEPLPFTQEDLRIRGHAIESRIYAEDPLNNFLPDTGKLLAHRIPSGRGVRVDAGVEEGGIIEMHYDPMIAKLITFGASREEAIATMAQALDEYEIAGVATTIPFCRFVMEHDGFRSGSFSTCFVERHFRPDELRRPPEELEAAAIAAVLRAVRPPEDGGASAVPSAAPNSSAWRRRRWAR